MSKPTNHFKNQYRTAAKRPSHRISPPEIKTIQDEPDLVSEAHADMTFDEQKDLILSILVSYFLEDGLDNLGSYLLHVRFDISAIRKPLDLRDAWVAHYRIKPGLYDTERAIEDLITWPPIAAYIAELEADKKV